jgi:general secretion pathway protein L
MSMQLVVSVEASGDGTRLADEFRWCWINPRSTGEVTEASTGDRDALRVAVADSKINPLPTWLVLPGCRVNTRQLEYTEKEKKHLRNLLPFQLEESVIGDIDDLHFALGAPTNGKVTVAFADKQWLENIFAELAELGIEVTRCWSASSLLPMTTGGEAIVEENTENWFIGSYRNQVHLRYTSSLGFSVSLQHASIALQMLLSARNSERPLPNLYLRAENKTDLASLIKIIPASLHPQIKHHLLANEWDLDFNPQAIDLCQGDFSQKLPIDRWWKLWQSVGIFAGICVLVYLAMLMVDIQQLKKDNMVVRKQIETTARTVAPASKQDPEKQLAALLQQSKPVAQSVRVVELLSLVLPQIAAAPSVSIKAINFTNDTNELNINIQADSFSAFDNLSQAIRNQGLNAEILSANVQGNVQSARLKISKNQ